MERLFNVAVGGLPNLRLPAAFRLRYSEHAKHAATQDKYGDLSPYLPNKFPANFVRVVEVEVPEGASNPSKLVVRYNLLSHPKNIDLVMVLIPSRDSVWFVKTVWGNANDDNHSTLRKGRINGSCAK